MDFKTLYININLSFIFYKLLKCLCAIGIRYSTLCPYYYSPEVKNKIHVLNPI